MSRAEESILSSRNIHGIGIGVSIALTFVLYVGCIYPLIQIKRQELDQRVELAGQRLLAQKVDGAHNLMRLEMISIDRSLKQTSLQLQSASVVNQRLAHLAELATKLGLAIHQIRPEGIQHGSHADTVVIHLSGEGTFETYTNYLHQLHQIFADISVVSFELKGDPNRLDGVGTFRLTLYWHTMANSH